jgi:hypothetical protein
MIRKALIRILVLSSIAFILLLLLSIVQFITIRYPIAYPITRYLWESKAIPHFPAPVPNEAVPVSFYYNMGALQAPTEMELRLKYSPHEFSEELMRLNNFEPTEDAKQFSEIFEKNDFRTIDFKDIPKFNVRTLHCRPTFYGEKPSWNHGTTFGYAWNDSLGDVIYWTNSW